MAGSNPRARCYAGSLGWQLLVVGLMTWMPLACSSDEGEPGEPVEGNDASTAEGEAVEGALPDGAEGSAETSNAVADADLTTAPGESFATSPIGSAADASSLGTEALPTTPPAPDPATIGGSDIVQSPGAKWAPGDKPSPTSTPSTPASSGAVGTYTVRPGDTLGAISTKLYGTMSQWHALAQLNGLKEPYLLYPGQTLSYSGDAKLAAKASVAATAGKADQKLTVKKGDTLWKLAQAHLGDPYAWKLFVTWNPKTLANPDQIAPGMVLHYGKATSGKTAAHQPKAKGKGKKSGGSKDFKVSAPKKAAINKIAKKSTPPPPAPAPDVKKEEPQKSEAAAAAETPVATDAPPSEAVAGGEASPEGPASGTANDATPVEDFFDDEEAE